MYDNNSLNRYLSPSPGQLVEEFLVHGLVLLFTPHRQEYIASYEFMNNLSKLVNVVGG